MKAIYSLHLYGRFSCRIPKVNGKGYLISCMGGHHVNEASRKFHDVMLELGDFQRDICDIDGYLTIPQEPGMIGKSREADADLIKKALSITFPRITKWVEVDFSIISTRNPEKFISPTNLNVSHD